MHRRLDDESETHLFRIAQEALTNIARHSGATRVDITLREAEDKIWLSIEVRVPALEIREDVNEENTHSVS